MWDAMLGATKVRCCDRNSNHIQPIFKAHYFGDAEIDAIASGRCDATSYNIAYYPGSPIWDDFAIFWSDTFGPFM